MQLRGSMIALLFVLAFSGAAAIPNGSTLIDDLRALPDQWAVAMFAFAIGIMMLFGTEQLLKIVLVLVLGVCGGIAGMSKVEAIWSLTDDSPEKQLAGLEIGLVVAYLAYLGYDGVHVAFGTFVGLVVAWKSIDLLDKVGVHSLSPEAGNSHTLPLLYYSFWGLGATYFFDKGGHLRYLGAASSVIGGALVSSAVSWGITNMALTHYQGYIASHNMTPVNAPWVDFLYLLISGRSTDVGIFAGWGPANNGLGGMAADRLCGQVFWAILTVLGMVTQWDKHSYNKLAGAYDSSRTVLTEKLLS